jgi:hypothetical protein
MEDNKKAGSGPSKEHFHAMISQMQEIEARSVDWITLWKPVELDDQRTDWLRFGREQETGLPGFAQIIVHGPEDVESHPWQRLADENELQSAIAGLDK